MNDHVIMQRIDEHEVKLEGGLSVAHNELLELKCIYNNEAVPPGYRRTDDQIEDIELLSELVGAVCGALTENGTTTEQDEMLNEILNVLRAIKHLRKLEEEDEPTQEHLDRLERQQASPEEGLS